MKESQIRLLLLWFAPYHNKGNAKFQIEVNENRAVILLPPSSQAELTLSQWRTEPQGDKGAQQAQETVISCSKGLCGLGRSRAGGQDSVTEGPVHQRVSQGFLLRQWEPRKELNMEKSDLNFRKLIVAALWRMNWGGEKREMPALGALGVNVCAVREVKQG